MTHLLFHRMTRISVGYNPWQCKCLNDLLLWALRSEITYTSITFNGERPVCVSVPQQNKTSCVRDMAWVNENNIVQLYDNAIRDYESSTIDSNTPPPTT